MKKVNRPDGETVACGCGVPAAGIGPGGRAAGVDTGLERANLNHLKRIEGQVRGIATMIEQQRYCADIITQVAAVRESLNTVAHNLMRNHLTHCAAAALRDPARGHEAVIEELLDLVGKVSR